MQAQDSRYAARLAALYESHATDVFRYALHVFTLSEYRGREWFLRSFLGIGMPCDPIKQFARRGVTRSGGLW